MITARASTTCFVCHGRDGEHGEHCFMRPDVLMTAPRGGIEYQRSSGYEPTPIYDALVAEHNLDPVADLMTRRFAEQMQWQDLRIQVALSQPSATVLGTSRRDYPRAGFGQQWRDL